MKSWIVGNWKLNPESLKEVDSLVANLVNDSDHNPDVASQCHLMIAPSFIHLGTVQEKLQASSGRLKLAAQDVTSLTATTGAFTGDVSAQQLQDMGVQWAIIGHSERRQYCKENNDILRQKLLNCAAQNLGAILCIGELEADFDAGNTQQVLAQQLTVIDEFLQQLHSTQNANDQQDSDYATHKLMVAYEPVWAIGTGKVPSVEDVAEVHAFIRQRLQSFSAALSTTPILYGGSVKPENAQDFASCEQVNGVLVGGAALNAESFLQIAKAFVN